MTLSGPNACLGSTKEARMRPAFLHSERREEGSGLWMLRGIAKVGARRL